MNIRKFVVAATSLEDLVGFGTLTPEVARFLEAAVASGLNVLVSGGTQAGKTTLLNCLAAAIPARERVVTCEEVIELDPELGLISRGREAHGGTRRAASCYTCSSRRETAQIVDTR